VQHVLASHPTNHGALALSRRMCNCRLDFVPNSFVHGRSSAVRPCRREGTSVLEIQWHPGRGARRPAHQLQRPGEPLSSTPAVCLQQHIRAGVRGADSRDQSPVDLKFGPDDCAYLVDYGAVRDFGQSDPDSKFKVAGDGPLLQIPGRRNLEDLPGRRERSRRLGRPKLLVRGRLRPPFCSARIYPCTAW